MKRLSLRDAVEQLRGELLDMTSHEDPAFLLNGIEVVLTVATEVEAGAKGGFSWWVVSAESELKASRQVLHEVKLQLTPRWGPTPVGRVAPAKAKARANRRSARSPR